MTPARGVCALPKDGLASQKRGYGLRKVLKSPSSSIAKRHETILPCIFWCLAGVARFPRSTSRAAGPVRRVTCTKNKLILVSRHQAVHRSRFDASPPPRKPLVARLLMILHHFLICDFATATPELLLVIAKRRVPFSRRNNGEDVGKGLVQDVNHHKDDPRTTPATSQKRDPSRQIVTR